MSFSNTLQQLIRGTHEATVSFLETELPSVFGDEWWKKNVVYKLSIQQERIVKEKNITSLGQLDFAAALRVFDKNWRELTQELSLSNDGRTILNEVRNIRNRLAHESLEDMAKWDCIRSVDTIFRFLTLINASDELIAEADRLRDEILSGQSADQQGSTDDQDTPPLDEKFDNDADSDEGVEDEEQESGLPMEHISGDISAALDEILRTGTFVGIDFGTSTTVASVVKYSEETGAIQAIPIPIRQKSDIGASIEDHLLPSCVAWVNKELLIGHGAKELKEKLTEEKNVWSSFKMKLGIDLGPMFPTSELSEGKGPVTIERPQDVATVFFAHLKNEIEEYVQKENLPGRIYYSVSVPASFEANQRIDLINAMERAGIDLSESSLIDEPNAAFLSYFTEMQNNDTGSTFPVALENKAKKVLVFDFGAGTCDISILEISVVEEHLFSKNISISRFLALGGDDIDRAIATKVLLPQLCGNERPGDCFSSGELRTMVIPPLMVEAERLKVNCSRIASVTGARTLHDLESLNRPASVGKRVGPLTIKNKKWELSEPKLSFEDFADALRPFVNDDEESELKSPSILSPIRDALEKAGLQKDELDMVLFIGGSSENPAITAFIEDFVGRFVECVRPADLRSHVSQGAAVNSLFLHGFHRELIKPITSETISIVTRGNVLETILAAGTPVPSSDIRVTHFVVDEEEQAKIDLPICVGSIDKIIGIVELRPPGTRDHFNKGEEVTVSCNINKDKLLNVRVRIGDVSMAAKILNPLANGSLPPQKKYVMRARQKLNESILHGKGRPSIEALQIYSRACDKASMWREAAEALEAVEMLDRDRDYATQICYFYSKSGEARRSASWSQKAYERNQNAATCFNLSLNKIRSGNNSEYESLMEACLRHDSNYTAALVHYGHYLYDQGDARGMDLMKQSYEIFIEEEAEMELSEGDHYRFERVASTLGHTHVVDRLKSKRRKKVGNDDLIDHDNLVIARISQNHLEG